MAARALPLKDIAEVVRGVTFSRTEAKSIKEEQTVPVIRAGNIQQSLHLDDNLIYVPRNKVSERQRLRRGDIVICTSSGSADIVGKTAYCETDWEGSFGAFCAAIRTNGAACDSRFLFHFLQSPTFRRWTRKSSGANIKNIRKSELDNFPVPVPDMSEQRRIATILDKADAIRRKREQALTLADDFLRSAFLEMFGDPITNPKEWTVENLEGLVVGKTGIVDGPFGSAINTKVDYIPDGEIPVIRTKNVGRFEFIDDDLKLISRQKFESVQRSAVFPGDIVLTKVGTIGNVCLFPQRHPEAVLSTTGSCRIKINTDKVLGVYTLFFLDFYKPEMLRIASAAVQPFLNLQHIKGFRVPVPPLSKQAEFASLVSCMGVLQQRLADSSQTAEIFFRSLSQRAFRGEL